MTAFLIVLLLFAVMYGILITIEKHIIDGQLQLADRDLDAALHREIKAATQAATLAFDVLRGAKRLAIAHKALTDIQTQNAGQATFEVWAKQIAKDALLRVTPLEPTEVMNPPMPTKL